MFVLEFSADGRPRPKGSRDHYVVPGQKRIRSAAVGEEALKHWTTSIRSAASEALTDSFRMGHGAPYPRAWPGPVLVLARYRLTRPTRLADTLADEPATVTPDGDKLERALWDALTGLAFADDRQVIGWCGIKGFAGPLELPGVTCRVIALDELEPIETPAVAILSGELERWRMTW